MNQTPPADNLVGIKRIQHYSYVLSQEIGRGYSSNVYRGKDDRTNEIVAIKVVNHKKLEDQFHKDLLKQEIECLKELRNEQNILKLLDVYSTTNNTYIITQLCDNKDLAKLIKSKGKLSEEASIGIMKQIINGLANLQKHRIIHRDLKPMNIFFKNGVVKIADFGFAFKDGTPVQKYNLGSPSYMPPEVLRDNKYSFKSDIWALGVIMYQMIHGKVPWQSNNQMILLAFITQQAIETIVKEQLKNKVIITDFMKRCCNPTFEARMNPNQLQRFDWGDKKNNQSIILQNPNITPRPQSIVMPAGTAQSQIPLIQPITSNMTQRQTPRSDLLIPTIPTIGTLPPQIPPNIQPTVQTYIQPHIKSQNQTHNHQIQPRGQNTARMISNLQTSTDGFSSVATDAIISQIHYCRFAMLIIQNVQKMQDNEIKRQLWELFSNQILQKIGLLFNMCSNEQNILQLQGFQALIKLPNWQAIKQLIGKYRTRYIRYFNKQNAHYNSDQTIIINAIKYLNHSTLHVPLLQQLVIFYQIKLLEKKIDYNQFGNASKIQNVVSAMQFNKPDLNRLRNKISLLGL